MPKNFSNVRGKTYCLSLLIMMLTVDFSWTISMEMRKLLSVLMKWMKLEPIIQSEVSQKEKHQSSILTHIYGI